MISKLFWLPALALGLWAAYDVWYDMRHKEGSFLFLLLILAFAIWAVYKLFFKKPANKTEN
ncbi:MAG: hypothetical protein ABIT81_02060 [Ferruginibacter sp.]